MRFRFSSSWILILSISISLYFIECLADESRSTKGRLHQSSVDNQKDKADTSIALRQKRTVKFDDIPLSIKKRLAENLQTIADYEEDAEDEAKDEEEEYLDDEDYKDSRIVKREAINEEDDADQDSHLEIEKNNREERDTLDKEADLEIAKSELEKVEKKVEEEILNLKKRSKTFSNDNKRQIDAQKSLSSSVPRLVKIQVDTLNIGDLSTDHQSINERDDRSTAAKAHKSASGAKKHRSAKQKEIKRVAAINHKERDNEKRIEDAIQMKIDAIKEKVRREVAEEWRIKEIRKNNAKYDEIQRLNTRKSDGNLIGKDLDPPSQSHLHGKSSLEHKKILKRSASVHKEPKKVKKSKLNHKKMKKSIVIPNDARVKGENTLLAASILDSNVQESPSNAQGQGNRFARRLRKPPGAEQKPSRAARRLRDPPGAAKPDKRVSRRLRKPPGGKRKIEHHRRHAGKIEQRIATSSNFLFPGRLHQKRMSPRHKKSHVSEKHLSKAKHKHRKQADRLTSDGEPAERAERAVDKQFDELGSNSVAESDGLVDVANSQDLSPLAPEYKEAFGGLSNDPGTSLMRYKRIKRFEAV